MDNTDTPNPQGPLELTGSGLSLEEMAWVALDPAVPVTLSPSARVAIQRSRDFVESLLEGDDQIYGVTTGFGRLAEVVIPPSQREQLQTNLIRSHSAGVGSTLETQQVRAIMTLRANALSRGHS